MDPIAIQNAFEQLLPDAPLDYVRGATEGYLNKAAGGQHWTVRELHQQGHSARFAAGVRLGEHIADCAVHVRLGGLGTETE